MTATVGVSGESTPGERNGGAQSLRSVAIVTHCIENLDRSEAAWSQLLGYVTVESGVLSRPLCEPWDTPAAEGQRFCLMRPASGEEVFIRFVETGERGHAPPGSRGWSATELLVTDTDDLARRIEGTDFRRLGGPADLYARSNAPRAMQVIGPSGELIYFTRLLPGGSRYGLRQARSYVDRPFIVTLGGPAAAGLHEFYGTRLGHRIMERTPFVNSILARLCGLPPGTVFPTAVVRIPGRHFLLELDEYPPAVPPRMRRPGHLPPGMSMVSFLVRSLDAIESLGIALRAPPRALQGAPYCGRRVGVIEGPVGEWLELIEDAGC